MHKIIRVSKKPFENTHFIMRRVCSTIFLAQQRWHRELKPEESRRKQRQGETGQTCRITFFKTLKYYLGFKPGRLALCSALL